MNNTQQLKQNIAELKENVAALEQALSKQDDLYDELKTYTNDLITEMEKCKHCRYYLDINKMPL